VGKGWVKKIFGLVSQRAGDGYVTDSKAPAKPIAHDADDLLEIRDALWEHVQLGYMADGIETQSVSECVTKMQANAFRMVADGFFNPITGIGTGSDPGRFNFATVPTIMAPQEAAAYYSNGGLPKIIIDKKAKGILLNGYNFKGKGWSPDECKTLFEYGELLGFGEAVTSGVRDGYIFGGSLVYPALKADNPYTTALSVPELVKGGILVQNSIDHFAEADRWNCVLVPNWDVTARDYLYPKTIYVPIGGVRVATARSAVIRPSMLPYWGAIAQIGWTTSDYEGYIPSILAYKLIIAAIPIMAQQMSLLFHVIPMDAELLENGIDILKKYTAINAATMAKWSMAQPIAINSFGEVKAVERHYEGFEELILASMTDVSAGSGLAVSILFQQPPKGLASDRQEDVLLKQSETIVLGQESLKPQLSPLARVLAISCFGPDYVDPAGVKIMDKLASLSVSFETPIVQTAAQSAEAGTKFATMLQALVSSEIPVDVAIEVTQLFFPDVKIPKTIMDRLQQITELTGSPNGFTPGSGMRELEAAYGPQLVAKIREIAARGRG
jgi:hypothetical protein